MNARSLSHNFKDMLAETNGSADENNATKVLRDKAYTLLLDKVSAIQEYGRYVFWQNEEKREKYYNNDLS